MLPRWFRLTCVIGELLLAASGKAWAAPDVTALGCDRPIHIAFYEYGSLYHQGIGIDPDVIAELAKRTGCRFETVIIPRAQAWQELSTGELDMASSGIATPARRKFAYFINYLTFKDVIVIKAASAPTIKSFDDVANHADWRIGVVTGYTYGPFYDYRMRSIGDRTRIVGYPDQRALYEALVGGEVQLILSPALNFSFYFPLDQQAKDYAMVDVSPAPPIPHGLAISRARFTPAMVNAWMRVIEQMHLDGTLEKIYSDRLPPNVVRGLLDY